MTTPRPTTHSSPPPALPVLRRAAERGHFDHGWLDTWHTFSFADYYDPRFLGFRNLRVINQDTVQAGAGFPTHSHRDMEIISFVRRGVLRHRDSMGTGSEIRQGEIQRMTAGRGVSHSEFNGSTTEPVEFLQIWLLPSAPGLTPSYGQRAFTEAERTDRLHLLAAFDATDDGARLNADARLYTARLSAGTQVRHALPPGRSAWVQILAGGLAVNGAPAEAGDGVALVEPGEVVVAAATPAELLFFDLP